MVVEKKDVDVVVVGGGPAGSTAATLIAKDGNSVLLLEKEKFPRYQIGESLLPATIQGVCKILGVDGILEKGGFVPKRGGTFIWGKDRNPWTFYFEDVPRGSIPRPTAYQVRRMDFDQALLENAKDKGVEVREEAVVTKANLNGGRFTGVEYTDKDGQTYEVNSRYIVDASGYKSRLFSAVGRREYSKFFNNIAIFSYFENGERLPYPNTGNILTVAFDKGWIWYIPLSDNLTSVGAVIDRKKAGDISDIERVYHECINSCPQVQSMLENATRARDGEYGKVRSRLDYSYTNTELWKPGLVLVGDAACFVDPVFSSGVHLATFSGLLAARSINTILSGTIGEELAFREFEKRYRTEYSNFYNFLIAFYDTEQTSDDYFWSARRILNTDEKSNTAFIRLISGYGAEGIPASDSSEDYFNRRTNISKIIPASLSITDDGRFCGEGENTIDENLFMKGFSREIVNMQALAHGVNLEEMAGNKGEIIPSADSLRWIFKS